MVVNCEQVWREISNYMEADVDENLRTATEVHFEQCDRCKAVLEGTRNVIQLYGDERMIDVPLGSGIVCIAGLSIQPTGRSFLGWMVAAAAALMVAGTLRSAVFHRPNLRSKHAHPAKGVPPDMMVVVSTDGKLFDASGCPFIHDKTHVRTIAAREALEEGYAPCVRCMKKYLQAESRFGQQTTS
jgi:hypothetical protein